MAESIEKCAHCARNVFSASVSITVCNPSSSCAAVFLGVSKNTTKIGYDHIEQEVQKVLEGLPGSKKSYSWG
jgi:hypothetical protein